ncbi:serine--tRNA ligase, mitochondrial [Diabrotica virgifera virgifera]|uniref:serine--tRNA ligase n=1 Tax=Diabrotica virgifera virgifera TaxID=50390 RepID=A0ABM5KHA6_DIAVI|nr:serine--tRNA ligase, mitochondrial [Diabrotica virgifera virgifera]
MVSRNMRKLLNITKKIRANSTLSWRIPEYPVFNEEYICDPNNVDAIENNILHRKGVGNIKLVHELKRKLEQADTHTSEYKDIRKQYYKELSLIPNNTHPDIFKYGDKPKEIKVVKDKKLFTFKCKEFSEITKRLNLVRTEQLGNVAGNRSYYIVGDLAELEQALVDYFVNQLITSNYEIVSVPDILPRDIIESCGMNTRGERTQVYTLDPKRHPSDLCLSGTSEMALAGYFAGETLSEEDLPKKVAAVSRCYRAETSSVAEERGIFRVHEFTKVEMFMVTTPELSDQALEEIRSWEEERFKSLGLHFQVLDMPPHELGAQAYRKYDIEAWMPGRKVYGEISSCSNCTDYQSRRLDIKYKTRNGSVKFAHTLNGTACALPRLLITLIENGQDEKGSVHIPEVLQKYMKNRASIFRQKSIPELRLVKNKKQQN